MADAYLIHIDQQKLQANFSQAEGREWTPVDVRAWLIEQGFMPRAEGWVAEEISLRLLVKGEYRVLKQII